MSNVGKNIIRMIRDGDQWCALTGNDLQSGIAGFGGTPAEALRVLAEAIEEENYLFYV
jgi:hypothetical protein